LSILAQIFDNENSISKLETFVSINGANHYNLKTNKEKIKLIKLPEPLEFRKALKVSKQYIDIFDPNFPIYWNVLNF